VSPFRIGHGYDVHQLVAGRRLIIGGVHILSEKGALGHSDADVLTHAICDALLGAASLGDIGQLFPNSDPKFKDISSLLLLKEVNDNLLNKGYRVGNIDATMLLEQPLIGKHIPEMKKRLSGTLGIDDTQVSVKATTTERLGFIGEGRGIAAEAVALIYT
jgi:2-C-methyl-D-erythritol 2,4-cyclodiphosphate synthase